MSIPQILIKKTPILEDLKKSLETTTADNFLVYNKNNMIIEDPDFNTFYMPSGNHLVQDIYHPYNPFTIAVVTTFD